MTVLLTFMATTALYGAIFVLVVRWVVMRLQADQEASKAFRDLLTGLLRPAAKKDPPAPGP
jgi:hypothetical protein